MLDVIVRTSTDPAAMIPVVQKEIQGIDKSVARFHIDTTDDLLAEQTGERRFDTLLISGFAVAALLLAAIGVYVMLHHIVVQRTNEIGVRIALGATPGALMRLFLQQGLTLVLSGALIGLVGTWSISRLLSKLLYDVTPTDPVTFGLSLLLLITVAGIACWIPSRGAARIDPILLSNNWPALKCRRPALRS